MTAKLSHGDHPVRLIAEALALIGLATAIRIPLESAIDGKVPFSLYFPCVALMAWRGGLLYGLVTSAVSAAVAWYFFVPVRFSFEFKDSSDFLGVIIFLFSSVCISLIGEAFKRSQEALAEAKEVAETSGEQLATATRIANLGVWTYEAASDLTFWDQRCKQILGVEADQALTSEVFQLVHPDDHARVQRLVDAALDPKGTGLYEATYRIIRANGELRHLLVRGRCLYKDAVLDKVVGTMLDETERVLTEVRLESLNQELERRVEERTQALLDKNEELEGFAYSVSHDMRTPLRAIVANTSIVLQEEGPRVSDDGRRMLERLGAAALKMASLVDDLLEYARLGRRALMRQNVDVTAVALEVASDIKDEFPAAEIAVQPGLEAACDPVLLRLVLQNLFENACKYRKPSEVPQVWLSSQLQDGETVFEVRDNGIGFDMTYADRLFKPFERLHREAEIPGSGIGLANAERVIVKHGGRIWGEAEPGVGARFYFTLQPSQKPAEQEEAAPSARLV